MPNPKTELLQSNGQAVKEAKAGKINFRVDKAGIIHAPLGKLSFETPKLKENCWTLIDQLVRMKPSTVKGVYIRSVHISSTMGIGYKLDLNGLLTGRV
jgi:large subunit ribosomal protein L1